VGFDDTIDRLKAYLVAKGYTQMFCVGLWWYFFSCGKDGFCFLFIAMVALQQWFLYQLDVKNAFWLEICKRFIWSNLQDLLLRGIPLDWYVIFENPYMAWNSLLGPGLENLATLFNNLVWLGVRQIIQYFIVTRVLDGSTW